MIAHGRRGRWYGLTADEVADARSTGRIGVDVPVASTYDDADVDRDADADERGEPVDS